MRPTSPKSTSPIDTASHPKIPPTHYSFDRARFEKIEMHAANLLGEFYPREVLAQQKRTVLTSLPEDQRGTLAALMYRDWEYLASRFHQDAFEALKYAVGRVWNDRGKTPDMDAFYASMVSYLVFEFIKHSPEKVSLPDSPVAGTLRFCERFPNHQISRHLYGLLQEVAKQASQVAASSQLGSKPGKPPHERPRKSKFTAKWWFDQMKHPTTA